MLATHGTWQQQTPTKLFNVLLLLVVVLLLVLLLLLLQVQQTAQCCYLVNSEQLHPSACTLTGVMGVKIACSRCNSSWSQLLEMLWRHIAVRCDTASCASSHSFLRCHAVIQHVNNMPWLF
jgi:hypothetical protein